MTVIHTFEGYGEADYGTLPYGAGTALGAAGLQFEAVIVDATKANGVQFEATTDTDKQEGLQFSASNLFHVCPGYGEVDYGGFPYGTTGCLASGGLQFEALIVDALKANGVQFEALIVDFLNPNGVQFEGTIDATKANGVQFESVIADALKANGVQFESLIVDFLDPNGVQFEALIVDALKANGVQFEAQAVKVNGLQFIVNIYNTNRLRVMCAFPSRGAVSGVGTNAWGNTVATGENWVSNSTATGDFSPFNLNTDIVEQVFRSAATTGLRLDVDTEVTQGVFLDTLGILNHNMTTGATLTIIGSNSATFATVGVTIVPTVRVDNIYHIEPTLPLLSFRYWRFSIDDATNTDGYIEIGTIVFGASQIMTSSCMIDRVIKRQRHFADSVRTEAFTSAKNDRALKNAVTLTFQKLEFNEPDFLALQETFNLARTALKCLWIPTPSPTDPSFTERFAVFAKMLQIPEQRHLVMGENEGDFIDLTIELDESE